MMTSTAATSLPTREKLLRARAASSRLAQLSTAQKNAILMVMADSLETNAEDIIEANRKDLESSGLAGGMRDRLLLDAGRIRLMSEGVRDVAKLPDPTFETLAEWVRPNGLRIRKIRVPLGVVGVIYESRPNVTVDTVALTFKTGNAVVLRGGKEAAYSNRRLVEILTQVAGVPEGAVELLDASTRDTVQELVKARGLIDVVIPRGGPELISYVTENATVPVIETGAGNCHIFVDDSADLEMADRIVINAKTQRPSVCNSAEKLLVHEQIAAEYIPRIVRKLIDHGVEVRGDETTLRIAAGMNVVAAMGADWGRGVSAAMHGDPGCLGSGRSHRAHQSLFDKAFRSHRYGQRGARPALFAPDRFRRSVLECFDPFFRWRGIRFRSRDGCEYAKAALPRTLCIGRINFHQV
jgi:glutamate-5-semialdehyde dehydrogenase